MPDKDTTSDAEAEKPKAKPKKKAAAKQPAQARSVVRRGPGQPPSRSVVRTERKL